MALQCINGKPWIHQYGRNSSANSASTLSSAAALATQVRDASLTVSKNVVTLIGGFNAGNVLVGTAQRAFIDSSGVIGTWYAAALGFYIAGTDSLLVGDYVYTFGGYIGASNSVFSPSDVIKRATVQSNGTLASWTSYSTLPAARTHHRVIVIKGRVHLIGGLNSSAVAVSTTYNCVINGTSGLDSWAAGPSLPYTIYGGFSAFVLNERLYIVGGIVNGSASQAIFSAPVYIDGTIGSFVEEAGPYSGKAAPLRFTCADSSVTTTSDVFVVSDGSDGSTPGLLFDDVWNTPASAIYGDMDQWGLAQNLTRKKSGFCLCITSSRLYILGGSWNYDDTTIIGASNTVDYIPFSGGLNDYTSWNYYNYLPAAGVVIQPTSEVSGAGVNGSFIGVVEQPLSEVSGAATVSTVGYGVVEQPLSEVVSSGVNPIQAYGAVQQELSVISGVSYNTAEPIFSDGGVEQWSDISGLAANGVVLGQVEQPLSVVFGNALVPSVCFGAVRDYLSQIDGFAYAGVFVGTGVVEQPQSSVSGIAGTWVIGRGYITEELSTVTGIAVNKATLLAVGEVDQSLSELSGIGIVKITAFGGITQENAVQGHAVCPNVGFGIIAQETSEVYGRAIYIPDVTELEYLRCSTNLVATIDVANPTPISYSRCTCGSFDELEPSDELTPLYFSR